MSTSTSTVDCKFVLAFRAREGETVAATNYVTAVVR